jgi:cation diffusion facilitator family transporter
MSHNHLHEHQTEIRQTIWSGIIVDTLLSSLKIFVGILGQSSALIADGFHSMSDLISSLIVMIGFHIAFKPPDEDHPYGHGRAETIAGWVVSLILLGLGVVIAARSVIGLSTGRVPTPRQYTLWVVALSFVVKEGLFRYKMHIAIKVQSQALMADAWHHRSDALSSIVVLVGIAGAVFGGPKWRFLDHLAAFAVAIIILHVSLKMFRTTWRELMDTMPPADVIEKLRKIASEVASVKSIEKLVARKSGLDLLIDIHVQVDPNMTVEKSHHIGQHVRDKIQGEIPNVKKVLVHIEPYHGKETQ